MCLSRLKERKEKKGSGYKVVIKRNGNLYTPLHNYLVKKHNVDKKNIMLEAEDECSYPTGFHIFTRLKDAVCFLQNIERVYQERCIILKVTYRDIVATGYAGRYSVDVAREMDIEEATNE